MQEITAARLDTRRVRQSIHKQQGSEPMILTPQVQDLTAKRFRLTIPAAHHEIDPSPKQTRKPIKISNAPGSTAMPLASSFLRSLYLSGLRVTLG